MNHRRYIHVVYGTEEEAIGEKSFRECSGERMRLAHGFCIEMRAAGHVSVEAFDVVGDETKGYWPIGDKQFGDLVEMDG